MDHRLQCLPQRFKACVGRRNRRLAPLIVFDPARYLWDDPVFGHGPARARLGRKVTVKVQVGDVQPELDMQNAQRSDRVRQRQARRANLVIVAHHLHVATARVMSQHTHAIIADVAEQPDAVIGDEQVRPGRPTLA